MSDYLPKKATLLLALRTRMTTGAWERMSEEDRNTIVTIIRGRCARIVEDAFAEFAELIMRRPPSQGTEAKP